MPAVNYALLTRAIAHLQILQKYHARDFDLAEIISELMKHQNKSCWSLCPRCLKALDGDDAIFAHCSCGEKVIKVGRVE